MTLEVISKGKPGAFWDKHCPTRNEIEELVQNGADYDDAADTKFIPCEPSIYDGDTDAVLVDVQSGKTVRYDFRDGRCYSQEGDALSDDYIEAAHAAGIPEGDASTDENLKLLISQVEPIYGSPENITLVSQEDFGDEL